MQCRMPAQTFSGEDYRPITAVMYIENIEEIAEDARRDDAGKARMCRVAFYNGLRGAAAQWFNGLDMETQLDWEKVKEAFKRRYAMSERDRPPSLPYNQRSRIQYPQQPYYQQLESEISCYNCLEPGHYANQCPYAQVPLEQRQANRNEARRRYNGRQQQFHQVNQAPPNPEQPPSHPPPAARRDRPGLDQRTTPNPTRCGCTERQQTPPPPARPMAPRSQQPSRANREEMKVDRQETIGRSQRYKEAEEENRPRRVQEPQQRNARFDQEEEREKRRPAATRRRSFELPPPIIAMVGCPRFDISQILSAKVTLTVGQLLDISPSLRQQVLDDIEPSEPPVRKRANQEPLQGIGAPSTAICVSQEEPETLRMPPGNEDTPLGSYTTSWVDNQSLPRTLISSKTSVDLISPPTVKRLRLQPRHTRKPILNLRAAGYRLPPVTECVDITVEVDGVEIMVMAYVASIGVEYDLLLSGIWMEAVESEEGEYEFFA
ncbi:MAG: hypothetical protein M1839_006047 [Geoglossum umbratile]|nr:MAG: hypothetical protein M1839_006047 [Geoglossum umbratile]